MGGLLAGLLLRAGIRTTVVARPGTAARIASEGLTIDSVAYGRFHVVVPAATTPPLGSAVIVAVKSYGLEDIIPGLVAARPTEVLSLLNGVSHVGLVHNALDDPTGGRVTCGSIDVVSARRPDQVIEHSTGSCRVTARDGTAEWRTIKALGAAGVTVRTRGTENEVLWRKLRYLAPMALLTAWQDRPIGAALRAEPDVTDGLIREVAAIATAAGLPSSFTDLREQLFGVTPGATSSLQRDVRAGGPCELEALGTHLVELGALHGIDTPHLQRIVTALTARLQG